MVKNSKPLVSVIIPTYNRGWTLKEAVDSVLTQDFRDFELIVVDDGSDDNTPEILESYANSICVIRQNNQGVSAARNKGVAAASGRFLAFLDSDDLWLPKKLLAQVEFFNQDLKALICQTEELWIRNGLRVNPKKRHQKPSGNIFERSLALCLVSPSAVMIARSLFESVGGFDENLPACEDYDLWLRISCRYPVYLIDTPLIIKRGGHADQLSRSPALDEYRIRALVKIIESRRLSKTQLKQALNMLKIKCTIYAAGCRKRGRETEACDYDRLYEHYLSATFPKN
ncbi:MAG: glycosyltransferase [Desulfobacterales bacterium]|nr:glycosyltransferase [Desulfobacterales bacterium]